MCVLRRAHRHDKYGAKLIKAKNVIKTAANSIESKWRGRTTVKNVEFC